MKQEKDTHVIVGGHKYDHEIPHREHRLALHLREQRSTENVLWLYPDFVSEWSINKKDSGIIEIAIPTNYWLTRVPVSLMDRPGFGAYFRNKIETQISKFLTGKAILWYYSPLLSCISSIAGLWDTIVYDCSDNHTTTGWKYKHNMGITEFYRKKVRAHLKHRSEIEILEHADVVFASSEYLYNKLDKRTNSPIYLEETGVDFDKFGVNDTSARIERIDRPRLGFVGKMKRKVDYQVLSDIAEKHPSWSLVLVGPKSVEVQQLLDKSNVSWIGAVKPDEVPRVMNSLDLGLMPYRDIEYNKAVFPLKFHEYLASGLPVVGCGLPSTERHAQEGIYIHTTNQPNDFTKACSEALSWDNNVETRKKIAARADWSSKLDRIYERVSRIDENL